MSEEEGTYAPRSPDLTSFFSNDPTNTNTAASAPSVFPYPPYQHSTQQQPPPHLQQQHYPPHHHQQQQQPPPLRVDPTTTNNNNWYQQAHVPHGQPDFTHSRHYSYSASASASAPVQSPTGSGFFSFQPQSATAPTYTLNSPGFQSPRFLQQQQQHPYPVQGQDHYVPPSAPPLAPSHQQQPPAYPSSYSQHGYLHQPPSYPPPENRFNQQPATTQDPAVATQVKPDESEDSKMPPRRQAAAAQAADNPVIEPSPVRTKFPTARIKRIMQADEEVGKVAQQTPIAVGKALELFMIQLVTKSAEVAREKNSKRVTPAMLKAVVEADDQWDFLRDIVSKVEQDKEGASSSKGKSTAKAESDSEDSEPKKRRSGRKKKSAAAE